MQNSHLADLAAIWMDDGVDLSFSCKLLTKYIKRTGRMPALYDVMAWQ